MTVSVPSAFLAVLCFVLCAPAAAREETVAYNVRTWGVGDGLPHNIVRQIVQDPDGFLWLASNAGLTRFDGLKFTSFSKTNLNGLDSDDVRTVFCSRAGEIWVGLNRRGIARKLGEQFEPIAQTGEIANAQSPAPPFAEDADGGIWWRSPEQGACRWRQGKIQRFGPRDGLRFGEENTIHADSEGAIWFPGEKGCEIYHDGRFHCFPEMGGKGLRLAPARAGGMWAFRNQQIWRYHSDGRQELAWELDRLARPKEARVREMPPAGESEEEAEAEPLDVRSLLEDSTGALWLATRNAGLLKVEAGTLVRAPVASNEILCLSEDRDAVLWVGTRSGLNRLIRSHVRLFQPYEGAGRNIVSSVCEDADGKLWITSTKGPPLRATTPANRHFAPLKGWVGPSAAAVFPDPKGGLWITTNKDQFLSWREGTLTAFSAPGLQIKAVHADRKGRIWLACENQGLFRWKDGVAEPSPGQGGTILAEAFAEDAAGRLWVGSADGLIFREDSDGTLVAVRLPGALPEERIRFLVAESDGALWIGARGALYRWKAGKTLRFPAGTGLPSTDLRAMEVDGSGNFWFASGGGLFRTTRKNLESALEGKTPAVFTELYGQQEGVPNGEFNGAERHTSVRTRDGRLWFATSEGALEIRTESMAAPLELCPLRIESLEALGRNHHPQPSSIPLPPRATPVKINYTLPNGSAPERLRFRHRLGDGPWVEAGNERSATYVSLPPGRHRFEVQSAIGANTWMPRTASVDFQIAAAWWETLWARAGFLLLAALALGAVVRVFVLRRVRLRMERLEQETAVERERTRIARDMHDELGASLTHLALTSDLAGFELGVESPVGQRFAQLARKARSVSGVLDRIVWTVNPRNDTLERLVGYTAEFATEYLGDIGIALQLGLPAQLPALPVCAEARHQILLAVKEVLNNAAKHGAADRVKLDITFESGMLKLAIADNGRGFDPGAVSASANGLINLRQRLGALGGTARLESQSGVGTTVTLEAPI